MQNKIWLKKWRLNKNLPHSSHISYTLLYLILCLFFAYRVNKRCIFLILHKCTDNLCLFKFIYLLSRIVKSELLSWLADNRCQYQRGKKDLWPICEEFNRLKHSAGKWQIGEFESRPAIRFASNKQ